MTFKRAIFISKTSMDQQPLCLFEGWIRKPGRDAIGLSIKPFMSNAKSPIDSILSEIINGYGADIVVPLNIAVEQLPPVFWKNVISLCPKTKFIFWSMDDPFKLEVNDKQASRAEGFHMVVTCDNSEATREAYKAYGVNKVLFGVPPSVGFLMDRCRPMLGQHKPSKPVRVPIIYGTNTYSEPPFLVDKTLSRIDIVKDFGWKIDIYGTDKFLKAFSDIPNANTLGIINYKELHKLFGRIIVNPHVRAEADYLNSRFFESASCGCPQVVEAKPCVLDFVDRLSGKKKELTSRLLFKPGDMNGCIEALKWVANIPEDKYKILIESAFDIASMWTPDHFFQLIEDGFGV